MTQELIPRATIDSMVDTWQTLNVKLKNSIDTLKEIDHQLELVFGNYAGLPYECNQLDYPRIYKELKRKVWKEIIGKTEIKKLLSLKGIKELEAYLESDKLEDITVENIYAMLKSASANIPDMLNDTIKEVFESNISRPKTSIILAMYKRYQRIYETYF